MLIYISFLLSAASFIHAGWVHRDAKRAAENALRQRELELVTAYAPKVAALQAAIQERPVPTGYAPQTIEELLQPFADVINKFSYPVLPDSPSPLTRIPEQIPE